jgi:hypothetical protein
MGEMAARMAARMNEDGGESLPDGAAAPDTGAQGTPPPQTEPSAGTQTTDTSAGEPGPIPYARFKEVNDELASLRPYRELEELGYDSDSLGRLASFDYAYQQDPVGVTGQIVDNLDLPDAQKAAIKSLLGSESAQGGGNQEQEDPAADAPAWARELLEDKRQREAAARQAQETREEQARTESLDGMLKSMMEKWTELDERDGLNTPENIKLSLIASHANRGGFSTTDELLSAARGDVLQFRDSTLGSAVQRPSMRAPVSGGTALPSPPVGFKDLREASKAAAADIAAGRLPTLEGT